MTELGDFNASTGSLSVSILYYYAALYNMTSAILLLTKIVISLDFSCLFCSDLHVSSFCYYEFLKG